MNVDYHSCMSKIPARLLLGILMLLLIARCVDSQTSEENPWVPAIYDGLITGKSTAAEVRKVLGRPESIGKEEDDGTPILFYNVSDPAPGVLKVYLHKGILSSIGLQFSKAMSQRDLIHLFGSNYVTVHYAFDECLDDGGDGVPIYENPNGPFTHIEYRNRGIMAPLDPDGNVDEIAFISKSVIPTHSLCKGINKKK
jgi:hypothetical protein